MNVKRGIVDAIGNTPLVRLHAASEATGCEILGKAEWMNPGGSVKDRAALAIVRDAEASGALRPGGLIVEGTAGNTGIGVAMVASALGYRTLIVIPRTQTQEKKDALRMLGVELVEVDQVPYANPGNYQRVAERLAAERAQTEPNGAVWASQFENLANRQAHVETTGPEIWDQTGGDVDAFVCSIGTGGTLSGVAEALRAKSRTCRSLSPTRTAPPCTTGSPPASSSRRGLPSLKASARAASPPTYRG
jgi:cysteine synthase A